MAATELAILVPVLRRPQNVAPLLDSIKATTTVPHRVVFICDQDDTVEQRAILADGRADLPILTLGPFGAGYAEKINHGAQMTDEPFLFLAADDLTFHPGWYEAAREQLAGGIAVIGTQDLCNPRTLLGKHATHFLVARWYMEIGTADEPGKLLHEGYDHNFVDDEFLGTARRRGMYRFAPDSIVEHHHPINQTAPDDDVYRKGRARFRADRRLFRSRRRLWM